MSKPVSCFSAICSLGSCLALLAASTEAAQEPASGPIVIHAAKQDVSPPLRDMVASMPAAGVEPARHVISLRHPHPTESEAGLSEQPTAAEAVLQNSAVSPTGTLNLLNFEGVGVNGYAPPDTNGSVGDTQFVQIVNVEYAVYDKTTGGLLLGPTPINTIWSGFGGLCETTNGGDPIVLYDKAANRWLVSQLAYSSGFSSNFQCIAVSTSPDATGSYFRYAYNFGSNLPDYPKFGIWPDAYYWSSNTFTFTNSSFSFLGAQGCAFERTNMLIGNPASAICFQQGTNVASLLPSDADGATPPLSGEPNFFVGLSGSNGSPSLWLFKFRVDFSTPSNSTFTGPSKVSVASFAQACGGGRCIPQGGT